MKKLRLISMLLSAALTLSSLPFAAAADTPVGENSAGFELGADVLDGVDCTADVDIVDITAEAGDGYLHLYDTPAATTYFETGMGYQTKNVTFEANKVYYISYDMRLAFGAVASTTEGNVNHYVTPRTNMILTDILLKDGTSTAFFKDVPTATCKLSGTTKASTANGGYGISQTQGTNNAAAFSWAAKGFWNINPHYTQSQNMNQWTDFEFAFVPTVNTTDPILSFCANPARAAVPMDFDNFEIYTKDASGNISHIVGPVTFDDSSSANLIASDASDTKGKFFPSTATNNVGQTAVVNFDCGKLKVENGTEYTKLLANTGAANVRYAVDGITLDAGEYKLSGEARLNYYQNAQNNGDDNKASLTESDEIGNPIGDELIEVWNTEYSDGIGWVTAPHSDETDISFAIINDYVYKRANAGAIDTSLVYDTDDTFTEGTYTVSGRVRLGNRNDSYVDYRLTEFTKTKWLLLKVRDNNKAKLSLTVNGETVDSVSLTNLWKDIEFTFSLDEACVPNISLTLDDTFTLDFADLTITAKNN